MKFLSLEMNSFLHLDFVSADKNSRVSHIFWRNLYAYILHGKKKMCADNFVNFFKIRL